MQQLLRWEISNHNDTTRRTAGLREFHTIPLVEKYKEIFKNAPFEIEVISALIIGGIYYLVLHANLTPFAGIDVNSEEGHGKICKAIEFMGNFFFDNMSPFDNKILEVAKKMREKGIESDIITECTKVPKTVLQKL
ncbi:hypothetical protein SAMN05216357_1265 [Porphyromonadaceae bacterium KH3CP3RA]|nr:hypothetical protein SAMN05216357_1265 [Porphyromonadaceae bacterium KH3CP3RA]